MRVKLLECLADDVVKALGDMPTRAAGLLLCLLGRELTEVGQAGGDGEPDAVHDGGDGGQCAADEGV